MSCTLRIIYVYIFEITNFFLLCTRITISCVEFKRDGFVHVLCVKTRAYLLGILLL